MHRGARADLLSSGSLMDFGSALPARIPIPTRQAALLQQDIAAEHCSMPFRAPELFDVSIVSYAPCFHFMFTVLSCTDASCVIASHRSKPTRT